LIRHALPSYIEIGAALSTTFSKLWSIFIVAATDPLAGDVICVLDALDECNEQEQQRLIKALENFCLHQRTLFSASRLKFLIISRPYFEIRREFDELLKASNNIELAGNDESASIKKEIDLVIKDRVAHLAQENRLAKKVKDHLEKRLLETEHRTYLWLRLLWEIIRKKLTGTIIEMNELIDNLPTGILDAYETLLQKCPEPLFARKVLQIVLVAGRPLTLNEMDVALNVNEQTSSYINLELEGPSRLQETLPSRCGLIVSIIQSKVYFIHQTAKEFLLGKVGIHPPAERTWQQSLSIKESHCLMSEICLRSITFSEIQLDRVNLCNALLPEDEREMKPNEYCQNYVFLSYSAIYWAEHYRDTNNSKGIKIVGRLLDTSDCCSIIGKYKSDYGTTLHAASAGGHEKIVQILLAKKVDVNTQGGRYGTALTAASAEGHEKIVQILLAKKVDVNAQGGYYGTALAAASLRGHEKIVQILLAKKVDVNAQGGYYGTALAAASLRGHEKIVQILLAKKVDVNTQGGRYGTALAAASAEDHEKIVQILLNKKANVNAQGGVHGTALAAASRGGHEKIVQILLNKKVDVNAQGGVHGTALATASLEGHEKIVQILLNKKADVNAPGGSYYDTALAAASLGGQEKIVQILLDKKADVNAHGEAYGTALAAASRGGHEKIVQILLDKKADVNAHGGHYGTALAAASAEGHEKIVQILLNKKADVNAHGGIYDDTALATASAEGHEKIVQILLNKKADVNAHGGHYGTALAAASAGGHEKIVQILLDKKADVNAHGGVYGPALAAASAGGHEKIVQILLNNGAKSVEELAEAPAEAPPSEARPAKRARIIIRPPAATLFSSPRRRGGARGGGARRGGRGGGEG